MPTQAITPQGLADLRLRAATRLTGLGSPGFGREPVSASGALAVLHDLATSPDTAADALAMLHELQVHQVEVELQAEALGELRTELEAALRRQIDRHDALPVACLTIDRELVVHELNRTAAAMLGTGRADACGRSLSDFLTPECQQALRRACSDVAEGRAVASPTLQLMPTNGRERRVRVHLGVDPASLELLLVLVDAGDEPTGPRP